MRVIENTKSISENYKLLGELIDVFLDRLKEDKLKNRKKILELCHVGKFLMLINNKTTIDELHEEPDFILKSASGNKIGLEHQLIVDPKSKEREGFFENIFLKAETQLQSDNSLPNFLANCYIYPYSNFKLRDKNELISAIVSVVREYVLNNKLIENPIIEHISMMPHSQMNINVNLGAWWYKNVTPEIILAAIDKKEKRIQAYKNNSTTEQWLLLVLGTTGESSFELKPDSKWNIETEFDRVFILEDFNNKLNELK